MSEANNGPLSGREVKRSTKTENLTAGEALDLLQQEEKLISRTGERWFGPSWANVSLAALIDAVPFRLVQKEQPKQEEKQFTFHETLFKVLLDSSSVNIERFIDQLLIVIRDEARKIAEEIIRRHSEYAHSVRTDDQMRKIAKEEATSAMWSHTYSYHDTQAAQRNGWTKEHGFGDAENGPERPSSITDPLWDKPHERK